MANNKKGSFEIKGFRALGFTLAFRGNDIEKGVEMYERFELDGRGVWKYGLEEDWRDLWRGHTKIAGRKLLKIHAEALREVFGVSHYQQLWRADGVVERRARAASSTDRAVAVQHFRDSLSVRKGQAKGHGAPDAGHQMMGEEMAGCIERIEAMVRGDRRAQAAHGHQVTLPLLSAALHVVHRQHLFTRYGPTPGPRDA